MHNITGEEIEKADNKVSQRYGQIKGWIEELKPQFMEIDEN